MKKPHIVIFFQVEKAAVKKYGSSAIVKNICDLDSVASSDEYSEIFEPKVPQNQSILIS